MANRRGESGSSDRFSLLGLQNHYGWQLQPWNQKMLASWKESYDKPKQCIKKQRHHFANKHLCSQSYGLFSSHVRMWEVGHKEGWMPKNWCFRNVVLLFIIARTWKQPRCPSADEWIRMLWYTYTMEYYSAIKKNTFESVLMRWMKLEPIIQSEVSQKEKHQYSILTHIYGI